MNEKGEYMVIYPEEMLEKEALFEPWLDGCHLKEDAPDDVKQAFKEFFDWFKKVTDDKQ